MNTRYVLENQKLNRKKNKEKQNTFKLTKNKKRETVKEANVRLRADLLIEKLKPSNLWYLMHQKISSKNTNKIKTFLCKNL